MANGDNKVAQAFYLAQLQACKGKCQCNVCKLLRTASDNMTEELLSGKSQKAVDPTAALETLKGLGYEVTPPAVDVRR